jgi:hypothetical protein
MVASVLVLTSGVGLFSALRVMHEPLAHLPRAAGPERSFAIATEAAPAAPAAPFQSRFPADDRPVVEVSADLHALRLDRAEPSTPVDPPPAQSELAAGAASIPEPADTVTPLDPAADSPVEKPTGQFVPVAEMASIELPVPTPDATRAIDPAIAIPLPEAAPPQREVQSSEPAKAKPRPRAAAKAKATRPHPVAKRAVRQHVAARPRRVRRARARSHETAATAEAQSAFPGIPFQDQGFQNPFQSHDAQAQRRAGGGGAMGGPFFPIKGVDPY